MIRDPKNVDAWTMSVYLKNGEEFLNKDITNRPNGENERIVSFWDGDNIVIYPMNEVLKCIIHDVEG